MTILILKEKMVNSMDIETSRSDCFDIKVKLHLVELAGIASTPYFSRVLHRLSGEITEGSTTSKKTCYHMKKLYLKFLEKQVAILLGNKLHHYQPYWSPLNLQPHEIV